MKRRHRSLSFDELPPIKLQRTSHWVNQNDEQQTRRNGCFVCGRDNLPRADSPKETTSSPVFTLHSSFSPESLSQKSLPQSSETKSSILTDYTVVCGTKESNVNTLDLGSALSTIKSCPSDLDSALCKSDASVKADLNALDIENDYGRMPGKHLMSCSSLETQFDDLHEDLSHPSLILEMETEILQAAMSDMSVTGSVREEDEAQLSYELNGMNLSIGPLIDKGKRQPDASMEYRSTSNDVDEINTTVKKKTITRTRRKSLDSCVNDIVKAMNTERPAAGAMGTPSRASNPQFQGLMKETLGKLNKLGIPIASSDRDGILESFRKLQLDRKLMETDRDELTELIAKLELCQCVVVDGALVEQKHLTSSMQNLSA